MPANFTFDYAGIDGITKGIYAIIETSTYDQDEASIKISELFIPIKKKIGGYKGNFVSHRIFLLADCKAIVSPIMMMKFPAVVNKKILVAIESQTMRNWWMNLQKRDNLLYLPIISWQLYDYFFSSF